jgi:hypothetical protein
MNFIKAIFAAVKRARWAILSIAAVYVASLLAGILMVHAGNGFALSFRDRLVGAASESSIGQAAGESRPIQAALLDFTGNLLLVTVPQTLTGIGIVFPYPFVAYQGWVGGIVSVNGAGASRFADIRSAVYYLLTLLLQISGFSLAIGSGINAGIAMFRPLPEYQGKKLLGIVPREAVLDIGRIYLLVIPLLLAGSLWEFLSPWNI